MSGAVAGLLGAIVLLAGSTSAGPVAPPLGADVTAHSKATAAKRGSVRLQRVDGGPGYWGRFSNALPRTPNYFPVGVWLESALDRRDIRIDKDAGLNTYVALTSNSRLALARRNGMKVLLQQDEWLGKSPPGRETAGWLLRDEIDMQMSPDAGYAELLRLKRSLPSDRRIRYSNFGKGVLFWLNDFQAARYVNAVDLPSADVYWFSDNNVCDAGEGGRLLTRGRRDLTAGECHRASNYGAQVLRVRKLVSPARSKPVWTFIEVGHPASEAHWPSISPPQIRAAVWHSIIAGARGITYFNHSFGGPCTTQHALREPCYARARAVVKVTNRQVRSLAPVLNAPFVVSRWTHSRATKAMVKWQRDHFYVFAGSAGNASSVGSFSLPCVGDATAKVLGEKRTIPVRRGVFTDSFADGNAVHIYRVRAGSGCRLTRPH